MNRDLKSTTDFGIKKREEIKMDLSKVNIGNLVEKDTKRTHSTPQNTFSEQENKLLVASGKGQIYDVRELIEAGVDIHVEGDLPS